MDEKVSGLCGFLESKTCARSSAAACDVLYVFCEGGALAQLLKAAQLCHLVPLLQLCRPCYSLHFPLDVHIHTCTGIGGL
jgi:hypothetical protein